MIQDAGCFLSDQKLILAALFRSTLTQAGLTFGLKPLELCKALRDLAIAVAKAVQPLRGLVVLPYPQSLESILIYPIGPRRPNVSTSSKGLLACLHATPSVLLDAGSQPCENHRLCQHPLLLPTKPLHISLSEKRPSDSLAIIHRVILFSSSRSASSSSFIQFSLH